MLRRSDAYDQTKTAFPSNSHYGAVACRLVRQEPKTGGKSRLFKPISLTRDARSRGECAIMRIGVLFLRGSARAAVAAAFWLGALRGYAGSPAAWPTYHGDAGLAGVAAGDLPDRPALLWRFSAGAPVKATPVIGGGMAFFANDKGKIFAVNMEGREVWSRTLPEGTNGTATFDAPLLCADGALVAGSVSGRLYALDPATGATRWEYALDHPIRGSPNVFPNPIDGRAQVVVLSQDEGVLHCLDLATGRKVWESQKSDRTEGSFAVAQQTIVFGNCAAALHFFAVRDGSLIGSLPLCGDCQVAGGVALTGDGRVFAGTRSGRVFCADIRQRAVVWVNTNCTAEVFTTPAVGSRRVVVGANNATVYCLDRASGELAWQVQCRGRPDSAVIAGAKVVVSAGGALCLLSLKDGSTLWSRDLGDDATSPAVVNGMILAGSDDGSVYAFGQPASARQPAASPAAQSRTER